MRKTIVSVIGIILLIATNVFCMDVNVMMSALEKAKEGISATFASIDMDLSIAAGKLSNLDLKGEDARGILRQLCQGREYLIDCAIIDTTGKMAVVEPEEYSKYEGSDISNQAHIGALLVNKKPVFSDVFRSVEGIGAIDFEYPVFSGDGKFLGSVSMLVKQEALFGNIIMPLVKDLPCKVWVMQKDGLIIYDPDSDQIGRNVFTDKLYEPFEYLVSFSKTVAMVDEGAGSYDFYTKGLEDKTVVKKYAVWDTVSLYGKPWRIIVMEADK